MSDQMNMDDWYSNKDLFEMLQELRAEISKLSMEMHRTTVILGDYNGLREELIEVRTQIEVIKMELLTEQETERFAWDKMGYLIGLAGTIVAIIALIAGGG